MQRRGAKNRPERLQVSSETEKAEPGRRISRRNGLFPIEDGLDGFDGLGRLNGGVRSHMRTRLDLKFPDKGRFAGNFPRNTRFCPTARVCCAVISNAWTEIP